MSRKLMGYSTMRRLYPAGKNVIVKLAREIYGMDNHAFRSKNETPYGTVTTVNGFRNKLGRRKTMKVKAIVFNGSPAGPNSATNVIASAFLKGATSAGAETEHIFLRDYHIAQCQGCFACWFKTPGTCVMQDDMAQLLQKYNESDIVCFATPVYTWNMTALLKNFVDRLVPLKSPKIKEENGNFDLQNTKAKTQKFVIISNCGFPGENNFDVLRAAVACCNPSLEIYRNCGKLLKSKKPEILEAVAQWLNVVEQAGKEMVVQGTISETTANDLNMPLMSIQDYVAYIQM